MALRKNVTCRVCLDLVVVLILFLPSLICEFAVHPFKRGFFCDDESIAYPYHDDTISLLVVVVVGLLLSLVVVVVTEVMQYLSQRKQLHIARHLPKSCYVMFNKTMHPITVNLYKAIGPFVFGAAANQGTTDIIKYAIGRLRPHFLTVCNPDYSKFKCTDSNNLTVYITENVCTGDAHIIKEARLSHPSGHSSFSAYCMVFLALYMQSRMTWRGSRLLRHCIQIICIYLSIYTCASRVSDYKHHWSDVIPGFLLGTIIAILTVVFVSSLFNHGHLRTISQKVSQIHKALHSKSESDASPDDMDLQARERQDHSQHII